MERYLSPAEVCEKLPGMTENHLAQLRFHGTGPRFVKISPRKVAYSESAIEQFMADREQSSTRENVRA